MNKKSQDNKGETIFRREKKKSTTSHEGGIGQLNVTGKRKGHRVN
jgi:hypothetical protein